MRFFYLLNLQQVFLFLFSGLILVIIFGMTLAGSHFKSAKAKRRETSVVHGYPDGIDRRNAPFPLAMLLVFAGIAIWMFLYILITGLAGVKI